MQQTPCLCEPVRRVGRLGDAGCRAGCDGPSPWRIRSAGRGCIGFIGYSIKTRTKTEPFSRFSPDSLAVVLVAIVRQFVLAQFQADIDDE
jgi:hypothetical protein